MALLQVEHLKKIYTTRFGAHQVQALSDVSFSVQAGEFVAIMGESGSAYTGHRAPERPEFGRCAG